jgi:hypothetical protein
MAEIKGQLIGRMDAVTGQGKKGPWVKQVFIIETLDQYPKKVALTAWNDVTKIVAGAQKHDTLVVQYEPESNHAKNDKTKWFTELRAYKVEIEGEQPVGKPKAQPQRQQRATVYDDRFNAPEDMGDDSLPY